MASILSEAEVEAVTWVTMRATCCLRQVPLGAIQTEATALSGGHTRGDRVS
jgi:hypothetical protein